MREILFKAKRKDDGKWIEGCYISSHEGTFIQTKCVEHYCVPAVSCKKVIPETLCQFTCLTDKNGKKIWENDIFQCTDETMVTQKDLIKYNETHASFARLRNTKKLGLQYLWIDEATCNHGEVIGNIFDNKELLLEESDE